jgi:VanZ family protein
VIYVNLIRENYITAALKRLFYLHLRAMKLKSIQFIPAVIWFIIANILFFMPGKDLPEVSFLDKIYFDKWVHISLFTGLTFLIAYPFTRANRSTKKLLMIICITCVLYGVAIEFIQKYFASDRSFDYTDMIADACGCIFGYILSKWLINKLAEKK